MSVTLGNLCLVERKAIPLHQKMCVLRQKEDAESRLQREIFFEFLDNLHGMCHLAEYMGLEVVKEGVLGLDGQGELTLDGDILPLMTEVEVKLYDKEEEQEIWTRTYVAGAKKRYLVGIDRSCPLIGMRARMRG